MSLWELFKGRDYHIEPSLDRIKEGVRRLGNPQRNYVSLLVGGTNGKGSTCAFTESLLRHHGYKTGWFVSPHLLREEERWRIDAEPIESQVLREYVRELKPLFLELNLTYFEAATLIAVKYFSDAGVDFAVFEVGMGGRWDATKVCEARAVAITNVERDHTRWLGRNLWEIASDKIELYRRNRPLILGSARFPLYPVALERARVEDLRVAGIDFTYAGTVSGSQTLLHSLRTHSLTLEEARLGLWGRWQIDNAAVAIKLTEEVIRLKEEVVKKALGSVRWEGRMEVLRREPLLMVDGAHNPYAVEKVVSEILKYMPDIDILFTGLKEKQWYESMAALRKFKDRILLVQVSHHRGEDIGSLVRGAKELGFKNVKVLKVEDLKDYPYPLLALGSTYLIGEIKRCFSS